MACWVRRGQEERQNARAQCNELTLVKLMELMSQWAFDIDALSLRHAWWNRALDMLDSSQPLELAERRVDYSGKRGPGHYVTGIHPY